MSVYGVHRTFDRETAVVLLVLDVGESEMITLKANTPKIVTLSTRTTGAMIASSRFPGNNRIVEMRWRTRGRQSLPVSRSVPHRNAEIETQEGSAH